MEELKWLVWSNHWSRSNKLTRKLVAAFADENDAFEYGQEYIKGEFTDFQVLPRPSRE